METGLLVEHFMQSRDNAKSWNLLLYVISEERKQGEKIREPVFQRLKEDYLIDMKRIVPGTYRPSILMRHLFSDEFFSKELAPVLVRLIKRQESNIEIIRHIMSLQWNIDYSLCAEEILIDGLSSFYTSKTSESASVYIAEQVTARTRSDPAVLQKVLEHYISSANQTNDENQKFTFVRLLQGACAALKSK